MRQTAPYGRRSGVAGMSISSPQAMRTGESVSQPRRRHLSPPWRFPVVSTLTAIALVSAPGIASACSCLLPENRGAAIDSISQHDVVFEGTVVRTFPGIAVYAVTEVYTGAVPERTLISASNGGTSCDAGTPPSRIGSSLPWHEPVGTRPRIRSRHVCLCHHRVRGRRLSQSE